MMIRTDIRVNTADERWTRLTKHMIDELVRKIKIKNLTSSHDREMEEMEGSIALAQVAMDKSDSYIMDEEQKRRNERLNDKEIEETIQQRIIKIEGAMRTTLESNQREAEIRSQQQQQNKQAPKGITGGSEQEPKRSTCKNGSESSRTQWKSKKKKYSISSADQQLNNRNVKTQENAKT
jgi:hypothetical protein